MAPRPLEIAGITTAVVLCALGVAVVAVAIVFGRAKSPARVPSKIPLVMYSTGPYEDASAIPASLQDARQSWLRHGPPGLRQEWASDRDARAFILEHFPQYLPEFDVLVPGAYRADLWRLLVVYKFGGIYVDCGVHFRGEEASIRLFWDQLAQADIMFLDDEYDFVGAVFQGVLAAVAGHPLLKAAIAQVVANIRARMYGSSCLAITGPRAVGRAFMAAIPEQAQRHMRHGMWLPGLYTPAQHGVPASMGKVLILKQKAWVISGTNGQPVLLTKTPDYYRTVYAARKTPRYPMLWRERKVYADRKVGSS